MNRGDIRWADLGEPAGSAPGFIRPVLIIQANAFNKSRIGTVICAILTSNLRLSEAPGNIFLPAKDSGLPKYSVINISQIITVDKNNFTELVGKIRLAILKNIKNSLKLVFELE